MKKFSVWMAMPLVAAAVMLAGKPVLAIKPFEAEFKKMYYKPDGDANQKKLAEAIDKITMERKVLLRDLPSGQEQEGTQRIRHRAEQAREKGRQGRRQEDRRLGQGHRKRKERRRQDLWRIDQSRHASWRLIRARSYC